MEIIEFTDGNDVVFTVTLDDVEYEIRMLWNQAGGCWTFSIMDTVLQGIKVVCDYPLLNGYHYLDGVPSGNIVCVTTDSSLQVPSRDSFADGICYLCYAV